MFEEKLPSGGRWIVTTLDPDYHFGSYFMPATESFFGRILPLPCKRQIEKDFPREVLFILYYFFLLYLNL